MARFKPKEFLSILLIAGLFSGLLLSIVIYSILFSIKDIPFSYVQVVDLHHESYLIYFIDALPFIALLMGYVLAKRRIKLFAEIDSLQKLEHEKNEFIKSAIQDLTIGNLNAKYETTEGDTDITQSLISLQSRLKENRLAEKTARHADQQRNWTSEGLAEFGDILRTHSSDRGLLAYAIISNLVRYLDINQGGFFIIGEENGERILEMIAGHAYERDKYPDKKFTWGEGLIGAVAIEKKSYYTDRIPDGYLTITSGLGRANPRYLLIVPLVLNDEVYGIFELASFNEIEDYQVQFVERVAENTAMTLTIMESNQRTEKLLKETQEQAAKLAAQEEQVRNNMEELKITQLEAARQSEQFISFTNTVNHTLIRAEYARDGLLKYANTRFLKKLGYSGNREVEGKHISIFIHEDDREWFDDIWAKLAAGGVHFEGYMRHLTKMGQDLWTMATYTCVRNDEGGIEKILFLAIDTTKQKEESLDFEGQIIAINKLSPKAEFSPDGRVIYSNELFEKTLKYSSKELENKNIYDFLPRADQERFNEIWEQVIAGTAFQGQLRMLGRYEEETWFRATLTAVADMYGEVDKIVFLAFDITKEKQLEISMRDQNDILKEKEEDMRLQSLDLRKQIDTLKKNWDLERTRLDLEKKSFADILMNYPSPVVSINNQGFVTFFNAAAEKYWNLKAMKVLHGPVGNLLPKNQRNELIQALAEPGKQVKESRFENVFIVLPGLEEKEEQISLLKTKSGTELIYTLIIHQEK